MGLTRIIFKESRRIIYQLMPLSNYSIYKCIRYFHSYEILRFPRAVSTSTSQINLESVKEDFPQDNLEFIEKENDVFGIESENGAIYFEKSSLNLEKFKDLFPQTNRSEVVHETTFGQIRTDSDNPPCYPRTFKSSTFNSSTETSAYSSTNENFVDTTKSNESKIKYELDTKKLHDHSFATKSQEQKNVSSQADLTTSEINHNIEEKFKSEISNSLLSNEKSSGSSYFDEQCFNMLYTNADDNSESLINKTSNDYATIEGNTVSNNIQHVTQVNDLDYIDQCFFDNVNCSEQPNVNSQLQKQSLLEKQTSKTDKQEGVFSVLNSDHVNFIDDAYFNYSQEKDKSENYGAVGPINTEQVNYSQQNSNILATNKNQEFVDNILSQTNGQKIIQQENNVSASNSNAVDQKTHKKINSKHTDNLYQDDDLGLSKETNKFLKFNFKFERQQDSHRNDSAFPLELERKSNVHSYDKRNTYLQQHAENFVEGMSSIKEIMDDKPVKSNENLVEEKEKQDVCESKSAIDYVLKLKKSTKVRSDILEDGGLTKLTGEKLDSKGFRILKNQVPDLSKLTHEELLAVLKDRALYQNDDVLVLDKPYNLVIHDAKSNKEPSLSNLLDDLARHFDRKSPNPKLYTVHRLDKETTGCLLLARNEMVAEHLKLLFAQRKILKFYWVVTSKVPDPLEGIIDIPIAEGKVGDKVRMVLSPDIPNDVPYKSHAKSGKRAVTHYKVISISGNAALVQAQPETGIKHQIRVHFSFGLGCPIIGDHKYSHLDKLAPQKLPSDLLQKLYVRQSKVRYIPMHIHARSIIVPGLLEGRNIFAYAPLPEHMAKNLRRLKFRKS